MAATKQAISSAWTCASCMRFRPSLLSSKSRAFSCSTPKREAAVETQSPSGSPLEPHLVHTPRLERRLLRAQSLTPVGSRRRRAALQSGSAVPFEQLPYQCFQEARKILIADREDKVKEIETQRGRLEKVRASNVAPQDERPKEVRIASMTKHLEELKIWADINDPTVKKRFEDGKGRSCLHADIIEEAHQADPCVSKVT